MKTVFGKGNPPVSGVPKAVGVIPPSKPKGPIEPASPKAPGTIKTQFLEKPATNSNAPSGPRKGTNLSSAKR